MGSWGSEGGTGTGFDSSLRAANSQNLPPSSSPSLCPHTLNPATHACQDGVRQRSRMDRSAGSRDLSRLFQTEWPYLWWVVTPRSPRAPRKPLASPREPSNMANSMLLYPSSPILSCRASVRSNTPLYQCWNEPVQVHFPRYRGPAVRLCKVAERCELAEGSECRDTYEGFGADTSLSL